MLLLVGQGNPGPKYAKNRHNIGSRAVEAIADRWRFGPWRKKFASECCEGEIDGVRVLILKPKTFYNETGRAVGEAAGFYKIAPASVIVFHDEVDLAPGRMRMKTGGGAAGNNGVRSITGAIGAEFRRARLGVGHPGVKEMVQHWVLSDFAKADEAWVATLLDALASAAAFLVRGEDDRYQAEVMRLAPAPKADPRGRPDTENP
jgi:peptidyl-tRNA hydrolase, PTH1 family